MAGIKPLTGKFGDFSGIVLKAAARGDKTALQHYLKKNPQWLNQQGPHGRTLLWEAAYKGRTELVEYLIKRGANIHTIGSYYTPLLVELSPLAAARWAKRKETVQVLLASGATDDFWAACHRGDLDAVKQFAKRNRSAVNKPIKIADRPTIGFHPIHYAVAGQQLEVVEFLINRRARVAPHIELLIDWADGNQKIIRAVKQQSETEEPGSTKQKPRKPGVKAIDQPDRLGFPQLVDACRGNRNATDDPARVQALLDQGATINIRDYKQKTALHRAAQAGFIKITNLLLDNGADLEAADHKQMTPIYDAIYYGRPHTVKLLKKRGANLNHTDYRGETPLFMAVRRGEWECFELLKSKTRIKHVNHKGETVADVLHLRRNRDEGRKRIAKELGI